MGFARDRPDDLPQFFDHLDVEAGLLPGLPPRCLVEGLTLVLDAARGAPVAQVGLHAPFDQQHGAVSEDQREGSGQMKTPTCSFTPRI